MIAARMTLNTAPFRAFRNQLVYDIKSTNGKIGITVTDKWPKIYFEYLRKRYRENAAGGGDWPPLSPNTLKKKTSQPRKGIMRVTDTLYDSLIPGNKGNLIVPIKDGVRVGVGGKGARRHPDSHLDIGNLVSLHAAGSEKLPSRPIVWPPNEATLTAMRNSFERGCAAFMKTVAKSAKGTVRQQFGI